MRRTLPFVLLLLIPAVLHAETGYVATQFQQLSSGSAPQSPSRARSQNWCADSEAC